MNPVILFRADQTTQQEKEIAAKYFNVVEYRSDIPPNSLVIPRYSSLPYYQELQQDVLNLGSTLINSYSQHRYIADYDYYSDIKDLTFLSWELGDTSIPDIPLVVKRRTNSKKWNWNTDMFAANKKEALQIACRLSNDGLIGSQGIIFKQYVPLKLIEYGINGMPMSEEYRFFYYKEKRLFEAEYWTIADNEYELALSQDVCDFADLVASRVKDKVNFFVVDVARKADGGLICVELNCGTMSGLPDNPYNFLMYENLRESV